MEENVQHYVLKTLRLPNFWMSDEYIEKAGLVWCEDGPLCGWLDSDEEDWFFPPIYRDREISFAFPFHVSPLLESPNEILKGKEYDRQYLYNPQAFHHMVGKQWAVFRKNAWKFPKRNGLDRIEYRLMIPGRFEAESLPKETEVLLLKWSDGKVIHDPETFAKFCLFGNHRKGLFLDRKLIGLNVWDENDYFINFRCCIDNGEPFLQEYLRLLFYLDPDLTSRHKLVNDGGDLDLPGLAEFKKKLNPIKVAKVYSNRKDTIS